MAWGLGLLALSFVLEPAGTIAFLGFPGLGQVGDVENRSLYAISPWLWAAFVAGFVALALRYAPSRIGWHLAVALSVFANPRLLMYQLSTLLAAVRPPDADAEAAAREWAWRPRTRPGHAEPPGQFGLRTTIAVPVLSLSGSWLSAGTYVQAGPESRRSPW